MNLDIEKDKRNNGSFYHKSKGIKSCVACKSLALKDITEECGTDKFYTRNYVNVESRVLDTCKNKLIVISINTTIY
jgi:hypothetical protein